MLMREKVLPATSKETDEVAILEFFRKIADFVLSVVNFIKLLFSIKFIENNLLRSMKIHSMTSKKHQAQVL